MYQKWNESELHFLIKNYNLPNEELAILLNRSLESIKSKSKSLGLKKERVWAIGSVFNRLRLIDIPFSRFDNSIKRIHAIFVCKCGAIVEKRLDNVTSGKTKSCGNCQHREEGVSFYIEG